VTVHVHPDDAGLPCIDVLDRGPGIPESVSSRLFRPFFTTSSHGTGLGLYIARELVEANGGTIRYEPNRPSGSRFVVELPADPARVRELNVPA